MTKDEAGDLAAYVNGGGGLVVVGANTGQFDEVRLPHGENALMQALGVEWSEDSPAFTRRVGQGRVAFLPGLVTPEGRAQDLVKKALDELDEPHFFMVSTQWHRPLNAADFVDQVRWTSRGFRFDPLVPDTVVVEFVFQEDPGRHLVHLVNYDLEHDVGEFEILCRGVTPKSVEAFTPDGESPAVEILAGEAEATPVRVSGFHRYLIVAIS